ncbi:MAG: phosphopantothenate/pantothenate synthetase [Candidatus Lokiarchaeota archaeon]|nr:phosphopantothenate/pantothenate synthetase [Candidatus Lokiarchaeota archaeon]
MKLGDELLPEEIPEDHPRVLSLKYRHKITDGLEKNVVAKAGLIAHGRGEAFDYLIGEKTIKPAKDAIKAACALLLLSNHPIISVNGNIAALVPKELVELSKVLECALEVNLFYRRPERLIAIEEELKNAGAKEVLGVHEKTELEHLSSKRRIVDPKGIAIADTVLVPLEDGDRTEALKAINKNVIAIDLNPMSRTSIKADITIVDNVVRCIPRMVEVIKDLKKLQRHELELIYKEFNQKKNLKDSLNEMIQYLTNFKF